MSDTTPATTRTRAVRAKHAATLVLTRRHRGKLEVLMGRRPRTMKFLPGTYVFPGGRVERDDARLVPQVPLPGVHVRRVGPRAQAFALAAIRETFEETGLVVGHPHTAPLAAAPALWRPFLETGYAPALDRLHPVARAVTPADVPIRFDTWFFAADTDAMPLHRVPISLVDAELEEIGWVTPTDASRLDILEVTAGVLEQIVARERDPGNYLTAPIQYYRMRRGRFVVGPL